MSASVNPSVPRIDRSAVYRQGDLALARREARRGQPLELVRLQWPELIAAPWQAELLGGDLQLDGFQLDILTSAFDPSITELFIKGCTKPGKGFAVALAANVWFDIFGECRVILASDRIDHARDVIFAEIAALRRRMRSPGPGRLLSKGLFDTPKHYMTIANPKTGEGFSGQHGPRTLFVFDEASAISDDFYDHARKQARLIIALSNPRTLGGWFRRGFPTAAPDAGRTVETSFGRRRCVSVGGQDCINVRLNRIEKPIVPPGGLSVGGRDFYAGEPLPAELWEHVRLVIPNQLDSARYRDIMSHPDPRHRAVFGDGRFPVEDVELQVILPSWLDRHEAAWRAGEQEIPVEAFGLDVAASASGDETVLAAGGRRGLRRLQACRTADTMQTVAWVIQTARTCYGIELPDGIVPVAVDVDGLGKGVADRLAEAGTHVIEIRGNAAPETGLERYLNKRAEVYGELARRLDPAGPWSDEPWPLVPDPALREELTAPQKRYGSDGLRFRLTPKDRMPGGVFKGETLREKLGRSTDRADAAVYLYAAVRALEMNGPSVLHRPLLLVTPEEEATFSESDMGEGPCVDGPVVSGPDFCPPDWGNARSS